MTNRWGILAGIGGVVINVVMTKMLVDWFTEREIATALGIFISSWPAGIAVALLILPSIALGSTMIVAWLTVCGVITVALVAFLAFYDSAAHAKSNPPAFGADPFPIGPVCADGLL